MNILQLYQDYGVQYQTEGHKHCRPGWINTACPFCTGNPGMHLGVTLDGSHFYCWRCGWKPAKLAISKLLNLSDEKTKKVIREYHGTTIAKEPVVRIRKKSHKLPSGVSPLLKQHRQYLIKRGYDPDLLEKEWNLYGTGPIALLDGVDYSHRILAPVFWDSQQVTFQARDISNRHPLKYMACPKDRELIHHKHILYGKQSEWKETGICVEGITDVWRFGVNAFATFGIEYTAHQVRLIKKHFKNVAVIFDDDPQAIIQARKLVADLNFRGINAFRVPIVGDPGNLSEDNAKYLVNSIL